MYKKYNSLFFDLDDTLLDFESDEKISILNTLKKYNLPCDEDVYRLYTELQDWQYFKLGEEINAKLHITCRFKALLKMMQAENIETVADDYFVEISGRHKLKTGALKVLKYLKEQKYKLYITTNGYPEFQRERIKASRISNYFDGIFISEEIGHSKPSKSFYNYVLNRIPESNRSRVLVIGDAPTADILGGINSGLDTCFLSDKKAVCRYNYNYKIKNLSELIEIL